MTGLPPRFDYPGSITAVVVAVKQKAPDLREEGRSPKTGTGARKSAWQYLNRTADPRLSMLRKFAQAVGVPVAEPVAGEKKVPVKVSGPR
jgi:hypothetical protein